MKDDGKMTDTQWPRFMVFQQDEAGHPYVHNGTVHASDPEMALLIARDIFSRRPRAVGMWVVPADVIFSKTLEELVDPSWLEEFPPVNEETEKRPYYVFGKFSQQAHCEQIGEIGAQSPQAAMKAAVQTYAHRSPLMWWVFPVHAVTASTPEDIDSMYSPVLDKSYREQSEYPTVTMMRQIRAHRKLED
ncbi:MAG: phenylacetic acid degradation protein [Anaerolineae bacterium]|nr:phenylacetic acid degradation protein [Anaerolineae bacterium]